MKRKHFLSIIIISLFIFSIVTVKEVSTKVSPENQEFEINSYVDHAPINITKDADFGLLGFTGDGSYASPYLIENLNITTTEEYGIYIEGVSEYFEIKDCYIKAQHAIYINQVPAIEAWIRNNTLETTNAPPFSAGLVFDNSHHMHVLDNRFVGYGDAGIYGDFANDHVIAGNNFTKFTNAIDTVDCGWWEIYDNKFELNDGDQYVSSNDFVFYQNTWYNNNYGLYLGDCTNCNVTANFFLNNNQEAVTLYQSIGVKVYKNWFVDNNLGGSSQAKDTLGSNAWWWSYLNQGNFWSDFSGSGYYEIVNDIGDSSYDVYPIWDSDSDGINDYDELFVYLTDRYDSDSDDDLMPDGWELDNSLDPLYDDAIEDADTDELSNLDEYRYGTLAQDDDTDGDTMTDGYEVQNSLDPLFDDAYADFDGDELVNVLEFNLGTKANNYDSDMDGMSDSWEYYNGLNPLENDAWMDLDDDGLNNFLEYIYDCDPNDHDSDGDTHDDGYEILHGTNPNDPNDFPSTTYQPTESETPTTETTFYWIGGFIALLALVSFPFIRQRRKLNKLRELIGEYFPKMKF